MSTHDVDVLVFGASSVTGRRVAAHLARRAADSPGASWAVAGRDADKLRRVLAEEGVTPPETLVADVGDPASLAAMASRARVVLNLVGPYTRHAEPVIEACVAAGSHYVDLTGELPFVRRMNAIHDAPARTAGVKVVQVCGFEALPPDLGVALAAEAAAASGDRLVDVDVEVRVTEQPRPPRLSDAISGGTFQSLAVAAGDPDAGHLTDPACLVDDPIAAQAVREQSPIRVRPRRRGEAIIAPMSPAAFINPAVIHRSAALRAGERGEPYAPFAYREGMAIPGRTVTLPLRAAVAGALSGTQAVFRAVTSVDRPGARQSVSRALERALPSSGYGPARDRLEPWRWQMTVRATTAAGHDVTVEIDADGHPGYLTTARLLGEAGLLLAEPGATPDRAGCLTPATALGTASAARFAHAGLRFSPLPGAGSAGSAGDEPAQ